MAHTPRPRENQGWAEELNEIGPSVEFLVRRERKLDVETDVAARRLEKLEKGNSQPDEECEASLADAPTDAPKVVILVDKWFVDKGHGFGKSPFRRDRLRPRQRCPRCQSPHDKY